MAVVLQATWVAHPGKEGIVRDALSRLAAPSRAEAGNLGYTVYQREGEPTVFRIFEIYTDKDAVTAHVESDHFQEWGFGVAIPELAERHREFFESLDN